jgi:hypothetical protein
MHVTATLTAVTEAYRAQEVGIGAPIVLAIALITASLPMYKKMWGHFVIMHSNGWSNEWSIHRLPNVPSTRSTGCCATKRPGDQDLAERVMSFHRENKLFIPAVSDDEDFAAIVCSLGLVEGDHA